MQDRLVEEAGAEAILCLQSSLCHEALQIDWLAIRERALERGVVITCVAVRDFDHNDQVRSKSTQCAVVCQGLCHIILF